MVMNFKCPKCGGRTKIINSRSKDHLSIKRRRECLICYFRMNTIERIFIDESFSPRVLNKSNKKVFFLFTNSIGLKRIIEATNRQEATEIAIKKGWTIRVLWELTYIGQPERKNPE